MGRLEAHTARVHRRQTPAASTRPPGYRPEIQGLRALAIGMVVIYHVWVNRVSGGVDVFFLTSGFLVHGQLVRAATGRGIELGRLWNRMVRRLFPAVLTVLAAVVVLCVVLLPETRWNITIRQILASAMFMENWQLIADQTDYFTDTSAASVVQNYWSLSIQGQFFLFWPVFIGAVALLARKTGRDVVFALTVATSLAFAASLCFSIALTSADQPTAYFHSLTRVWEFALGGLVALLIDKIAIRRWLRVWLGWLGVVGLLTCGAILTVGSVFPGYAALWPTLCAVAIIVAGSTDSRWGADRWLASAPADYLGRLSFSLYLWHWPILVLYLTVRGQAEVGLRGGLLVIGLSLLLSMLTLHLVEDPVRTSASGQRARSGSLRVAAAGLVPVLALTGGFALLSAERGTYLLVADDPDYPGALAMLPGFNYTGTASVALIPPLVSLPQDFAYIDPDGCQPSEYLDSLVICASEGTDVAARTIVIVGDSHAQQYLAALTPIAERRGWNLMIMVRGACQFTTESELINDADREFCQAWNRAAMREIADLDPDAVLTIGTRDVRTDREERTPDGYVEQWAALDELGIPVLAVRDNPRFDAPPARCVERLGLGPQCETPRARLYAERAPLTARADVPDNVVFLDFTDLICTPVICPPVIGNVLVYLDANHLSATYLATMSPMVERAILEPLDW